MSVASHLGIRLDEYDARIRTFIPDYEEMLDVGAGAVPPGTRTIVDLGTGTGALAARCLRTATRSRVIGIDADPDILKVAARRLGPRASFIEGSFLRAAIPRCDAIVSSFALHHIRTRAAKTGLYERLRRALRRGGRLISVDCQPSRHAVIAASQMTGWLRHLEQRYSARESRQLLRTWSGEDTYVPLDDETAMLNDAGFRVDVLWRKGAFAVLLAR
ncbi:MAG TPA: class I SAM-dependent methyltransferase [Vicinamibacterales bacterium]